MNKHEKEAKANQIKEDNEVLGYLCEEDNKRENNTGLTEKVLVIKYGNYDFEVGALDSYPTEGVKSILNVDVSMSPSELLDATVKCNREFEEAVHALVTYNMKMEKLTKLVIVDVLLETIRDVYWKTDVNNNKIKLSYKQSPETDDNYIKFIDAIKKYMILYCTNPDVYYTAFNGDNSLEFFKDKSSKNNTSNSTDNTEDYIINTYFGKIIISNSDYISIEMELSELIILISKGKIKCDLKEIITETNVTKDNIEDENEDKNETVILNQIAKLEQELAALKGLNKKEK